jgi:antirestriction protein ArdC
MARRVPPGMTLIFVIRSTFASVPRPSRTKRAGSRRASSELGAAFLCADLDLTLEPREDHAAYIANWLDVLNADNRAIFAAASHAPRAADFINGQQLSP